MKRFSKQLLSTECLTTDETLCATREEVVFGPYKPSKTARYGILLKAINDSQIPYTFLSTVYAGGLVGEPGPNYTKGNTDTVKYVETELREHVELDGRHNTTDRQY